MGYVSLTLFLLQDICLAEVALNLLVSGDVTLPEMRPGFLSLSVRTLTAELHEGLFLSQIDLPVSPTEIIQDACDETQGILQGMSKLLWNIVLVILLLYISLNILWCPMSVT